MLYINFPYDFSQKIELGYVIRGLHLKIFDPSRLLVDLGLGWIYAGRENYEDIIVVQLALNNKIIDTYTQLNEPNKRIL